MGEELENQRCLEMESGELLPELQLLFTLKPGMDRRRYNAQRTNEVAAVFCTTADREIPESYVTIRHDVAALTIEPITENVIIDHDEIHNYIEVRYVGPVEASWRILGRIYSVSPAQTELYHLRLLLLTVKGATSFNDLRTVNREFYQSFSAACLTLGLIKDDDEWKRAMKLVDG
ncbi:uncharacterized protein LOC114943847 [Nylanderia fulva]|uniref:uncharacterized protein LOC114943847 n=1 Tax=Nylanderia fulva TaxID=613905 RepID=UPI0010FB3F0A|nr:uncharacterized protein LOC114943847 [Nylanderia fulva]